MNDAETVGAEPAATPPVGEINIEQVRSAFFRPPVVSHKTINLSCMTL